MLKRLELIILGQVQGISFRYNIKLQAEKLGLSGWVQNQKDGTVKVVAEGEEAGLKKLLVYCQVGPPLARVARVQTVWQEPTGEFKSGFKLKFYDPQNW